LFGSESVELFFLGLVEAGYSEDFFVFGGELLFFGLELVVQGLDGRDVGFGLYRRLGGELFELCLKLGELGLGFFFEGFLF
jgi:hypothetical protein